MSTESIRRQITQCENQIKDNNAKIKELQERIEELKDIKRNFNKTGEKLYNYQTKRRNSYEELRFTMKNTKFAVQYAEDILEYVDGRDSSKANEGIENCIRKVEEEIKKKEEEIDNFKNKNVQLRSRISDLQEELRRERERERERARRKDKK